MKRLMLGLALLAGALVLPKLADPVSAAPDQISVWKHTDQQAATDYWQPTLNTSSSYSSYAAGQAYIKISVTSKPTARAMQPAVCMWRHGSTNFQYETCARTNTVSFTGTTTMYIALGSPNSWWYKNGSWNWSLAPSVGRIMLKVPGTTGKILMREKCGGNASCFPDGSADRDMPVTMSSELIFVAPGKTLDPPADWRGSCPASWSPGCSGSPGTTSPGTTSPTTTSPTTTSPTTTSPTTSTPGTTVPGSVPATDLTPAVSVVGSDRSLAVEWSHPTAKQFQMRYRTAGSNTWLWNPPTRASRQELNGLTNGQTYEVEVRAYIPGSWRAWVAATGTPSAGGPGTTTPTSTVPGSVPATGLTPAVALVGGAGSITATWSHPTATQFQVRYRETGSNTWLWYPPTKGAGQVITGLASGQAYDVEVRGYIPGKWRAWVSVTGTAG